MPSPNSNSVWLGSRLPNCGWRLVKPRSEASWSVLRHERNQSHAANVSAPCEGPPCVGHSYPTLHSGLESWNLDYFNFFRHAEDTRDPNPCAIMRLLEIKGPGEFSLVQVATHNTLPYAILSHTWVHDQEVTYKDLVGGAGERKTGYEKIKFCGEQATKDGLQYFWVDTCCINKSDSTELTTAINSMFRWYRNAKKCYVYLADVSTPGNDADVQSAWEATFRNSKWFTRGWTLQELIAPATVEFFSKEGKRLGDKNSLEKLIHEITRIPIQALQGNPFSYFSIAERTKWAVQRQTTEEEDMVYCLLGLCEVSMLPIYGEGKEAALKRLQMTVKEFSKDSSVLQDLEGMAYLI